MQNSEWISLLRLIPQAQQDNLAMMTTNGNEIAIQAIVRLDHEFAVLRGRLTGTTENGSFFIIPYEQITYLAFQRQIKETEVRAIFEGRPPASAAKESPMAPLVLSTLLANDTTTPVAPLIQTKGSASVIANLHVPENGNTPKLPPGLAAKTALLERLRNRRQASDNSQRPNP